MFFPWWLSSYKLFFRVTECAPLLRMFLRFYTQFSNLLTRSNEISHVLTGINQEIFFDQSQFISVVFLSILFSIFLLCLCILRNSAVFDFIKIWFKINTNFFKCYQIELDERSSNPNLPNVALSLVKCIITGPRNTACFPLTGFINLLFL